MKLNRKDKITQNAAVLGRYLVDVYCFISKLLQ